MFLLFAGGVLAARFVPPPPTYVHRVWQMEDGLPNNAVRAVLQTRDGYLWVATDDGLARFDGVRFTEVERKQGEKGARWIFGLTQTRDGSVWCSSVNGGIIQVRTDGQIKRYTTAHGLASDLVLAVKEDSHGNLWCGTGAGLCQFTNGVFISHTNQPGLIVEAVRAILEDKKHNLWIGTARGLNCWQPDGSILSYTTDHLLGNDAVMCLCEDRSGGIWVGTSKGLTVLQEGTARQFTIKDGLAHDVVRQILEDSAGNLWIGTQGGLQQFVNGKFQTVTINNMAESDLEGITYTYSMLEDREGNIWVGNSAGLNRLRLQNFVTYTKTQGLPRNETTCVMEDTKGNLWIGTYGGGLCSLRGEEVEVLTTQEGLASNHVLSLCEDRAGAIWIGLDQAGVQRLTDGTFTHFTSAVAQDNVVRVIYEDEFGVIWIGNNRGVARFSQEKFERQTAWSKNAIKAITGDQKQALWVTGQSVLARHDFSGTTQTYAPAEGFGPTAGNALYPDQDGCWVGTEDGLCFAQASQVYNFAQSPLLGRNAILHIAEDHLARLWMNTRNGVLVAPKAALRAAIRNPSAPLPLRQFGRQDGLRRTQSQGNGQPAGGRLKDGRMVFATLHGVMVFDPKTVQTTENPLAARIESVKLDGQTYPAQEKHAFGPSQGQVEFHYTAFHFQAPDKIKFKYMLEGLDPDWVEAGTRRTASYQLASGSYRFKVMACNSHGLWSQGESSLSITLQPHFYQTYFFYGLCVLAVIGAGMGLAALRRAEIKRHETELMRQVEVYTAKYRKAAQSMESFNYSIAHDLRAPLRSIKGLTEALIEDLPPGAMDDNTRDYTQRIMGSVNRMDALITDLLNYGQLTHKDFKFSAVPLETVLAQVLLGLDAEINARHGKIQIDPPLGVVWANETLLSQVFANLISNGIKFVERGREPNIRIWTETGSGKIKIFLQDNGIGIDPRFHQKVFGVFERLHSTTEYPGTGIGLAIVHKAMEQMGGTVGLNSAVGQGCCFWLELAKGPAASRHKETTRLPLPPPS